MSKMIVRLACALVLVTTFAGCQATGSGASKRKTKSDVPATDFGTPSESPFNPYPTN